MKNRALPILTFAALLSACVSTPDGPTVPVMPPPGKEASRFTQEAAFCKYQATKAVDGQAAKANGRAVLGTLLPIVIGAGLGAAIGSAVGNPWSGSYAGEGAGIGAGSGLLVGGGVAAASSEGGVQGRIQNQYDNTYAACMLTYGNAILGMGPPFVGDSGVGQPRTPTVPAGAASPDVSESVPNG
ncbi:glycine zipper family protein [Acetobacter sp. DsW_063]|uniref:glycine zipper family protein n=1 Tax=Acetobacter sp. DsW_063 TaxID=1514894 RepID=UPI001E5B33D6|nr:glycine zipper family protein [Acetobacter sp. DsW_063]